MRLLLAVLVLVLVITYLVVPGVALACEQCLGTGGANGPTIRALFFSMASLLLMIGFVGTGIGAFFFNMRQRARKLGPGNVAVNEQGDLTEIPNNQ